MNKTNSLYVLAALPITLAIFIATFPSLSMAAEWHLFFENQRQMKFYIDRSSILHLAEGKVRAWKKTENQQKDGSLALLELDCKERKYTIRAMEPIDKNDIEAVKTYGANVKSWAEPVQRWDFLSTSDYDELIYETWCNK